MRPLPPLKPQAPPREEHIPIPDDKVFVATRPRPSKAQLRALKEKWAA